MKTCYLCNKQYEDHNFSTLPRWTAPTSITDATCTYCYWVQLITHRAEYYLDGAVYVPRDNQGENKHLLDTVTKYLPIWMKQESVKKRYLAIGELGKQLEMFEKFKKDLADNKIPAIKLTIGNFPQSIGA